jgi:branched-chain amino acid transport system substrate-binding protein
MSWQRTVFFLLFGSSLAVAACTGDHGDAGKPGDEGADAIKVGAIIPLSREYESLGATQRLAYTLAQRETRQQGRLALKVVFGDSQLRDLRAERMYRRLVSQDKVVAFVEVTGNALALMLEEEAARDKIPIVSGIDTHPRLTRGQGTYFFRVVPSDTVSSAALSQWALDQGLQTAALVFDESDWGAGLRDSILGTYRTKGGRLPEDAVIGVKEDATDLAPAVAKLRAVSPQACFVALVGEQAGRFVRQAVERGFKGVFLGLDNLAQPPFLKAAGDAKTRVRLLLPAEGNSAASRRFAATYREKTGKDPDLVAIKAYESYMVVLSAIEAVQRAGKPVTGEEVAKALAGIQVQGLTGTLAFDRYHDLRQADFDRLTYNANGDRVAVR